MVYFSIHGFARTGGGNYNRGAAELSDSRTLALLKKSLAYLKKSLKIREEINHKQGIGYSLVTIGILYHEKGDYVICAVSGKKIPLDKLTYWNVDLQEAYFSPKEAQIRYEELQK